MGRKVQITQMRRADVKTVFGLQSEFEAFLQGLTANTRSTNAAARRRLFLRYGFGRKPAFKCLIAKMGGVPVGYICYHLGFDPDEMSGPVVYVIDLFVSSGARGLGIGKALMNKVAGICREEGGIAVYTCVWKKNRKAIGFYRSIGADWVTDVPLMQWPRSHW